MRKKKTIKLPQHRPPAYRRIEFDKRKRSIIWKNEDGNHPFQGTRSERIKGSDFKLDP